MSVKKRYGVGLPYRESRYTTAATNPLPPSTDVTYLGIQTFRGAYTGGQLTFPLALPAGTDRIAVWYAWDADSWDYPNNQDNWSYAGVPFGFGSGISTAEGFGPKLKSDTFITPPATGDLVLNALSAGGAAPNNYGVAVASFKNVKPFASGSGAMFAGISNIGTVMNSGIYSPPFDPIAAQDLGTSIVVTDRADETFIKNSAGAIIATVPVSGGTNGPNPGIFTIGLESPGNNQSKWTGDINTEYSLFSLGFVHA